MEAIRSQVPEAEVSGELGRSMAFEVKVNSTLIFSKLKLGGFPNEADIIAEVQRAAKGESPGIVEDAERPSCVIL